MKRTIPGILLVLTIGGGATSAIAQNAGDAKKGASIYYEQGCYGCHGYSGFGRHDLNNTPSGILATEEVFRMYLRARSDVAPLLPSTQMPNYPATSLNDEKVRDLYAYIKSMPADVLKASEIETFRKILKAAEKPYAGK